MYAKTNVAENETQLDEIIDNTFLLYAYMICADGQEHINESKALAKIAEASGINNITSEEASKILTQSDTRIPLNLVTDSIPKEAEQECMQYLATLAYVDGYCDPLERELLEKLAKQWGISELELSQYCAEGEHTGRDFIDDSASLDYSQHFSPGEKLIAGIDRLSDGKLLKAMKLFQSAALKETINNIEHKILLSGPDYDEAIDKCRKVAEEDIKFAIPALDATRKSLDWLKSELSNTIKDLNDFKDKQEAKTAQEVISFLKKTEEYFESEIFKKVEAVNASLHKKKRAMNCFTISFLGKTKAGKSTLHAVVTGEGEEAIGEGKQRTTRLNRVYEWKNIRIIDTPGIGAPGGKTDEEIAQSVIDESDLICFVLNNNNQQETEFAFLKQLKEKAKPFVILLNVKENLTHPRKLERFLQNPDKLFSVENKSALGGHLDRIKRYAEQYYGNDYFEIIPVQLYAALLAQKSETKAQKNELLNASRIKDFLDSIKLSLIQDGVIRRSQTLLGSTVGEIEPISNWTALKISELDETHSKITSFRNLGTRKIAKFGINAQKELKREFGKVFSALRDTIQEFAENYWDLKQASLEKKWEEHVEKRKKILESALEKVMNSYSNEVLDLLEEIGAEISLMSKLKFRDPTLEEQDSSSFMKNFLKIGGGFLGVAGSGAFLYAALVTGAANWWNPVGWVLVGVGLVMGLVSGLFTSKTKKMQKAVNNITSALRKSVDGQEKDVIESILKEIKMHTNKVEADIDSYFSVMQEGLHSFMTSMKLCNEELLKLQDGLNNAYAKRVIDWVQNKNRKLTEASIRKSVKSVERILGNRMNINTTECLIIKKTPNEIQAVLQEDLTIKGEQKC